VAYDPDTTTMHLNPVYQNPDWAKGFDVVVHDECSADVKDLPTIDRILKPHRDGLPAVVLHCGMHCYRSEGWPKAVTPWFEFTGLQTTGHGAQAPIAVSILPNGGPITRPLADWTTVNEELYNNITGNVLDSAKPLARGRQVVKAKDGTESTADTIVAWTNMYKGKTRVFATTLGHNNETVSDPRYLDLVTRGLLWSVNKLEDRASR
jgi:type 1 glutamine amidotransferase